MNEDDLPAEINVNVFDMLPSTNATFRFIHFGMHHSSIVIDNKIEIHYGGGEKHISGIISAEPKFPPVAVEGPIYKTYYLGKTIFSRSKINRIINDFRISDTWAQDSYNLFTHNCNSFTREFCQLVLTEKQMQRFPFFISRAEKAAGFVFFSSLSYFIGFSKDPFFNMFTREYPKDDDPSKKI